MNCDQQKGYKEALRKIDLCRWEKWSQLSLRGLDLPEVPKALCQLKSLKVLNLSHTLLTAIPAEVGQLTGLTKLDLSNNNLTALPAELGQLTALTELSLHNNRLTALPAELSWLTALKLLTLERNQLENLPEALRHLPHLRELTLHGNDALGLPAELLGPSYSQSHSATPSANPQAILDYYFARQAEGSEAMREVRVLLVGRGRVGKTSLLKVLRGETLDTGEKETPGITVLPLPLQCPQGSATGHVWDFGGQEFLHGTHQIFLSERCVYLLVLEGRESNWETETDYWLRFIQSFGGDSPVVVALNKYESHAFSVDEFRLREKCPQIVGFVQTDALTGLGIAELQGLLEQTVNAMSDVWLGVPRRWHRVKERLGEMKANFLDYKEYQALCSTEKVTVEGQQASLAETLHRLGIALNFRDHQRLKETSVLKPQWVTEGIYGVLRFLQKQDCHGVLQRAWLAGALQPAKDYPPEKHGFVMELMEKFEVAFALESHRADELPRAREAGVEGTAPSVLGADTPSRAADGQTLSVLSTDGVLAPSLTAAAFPRAATSAVPSSRAAAAASERWLIPELLPEVQPAAFAEFRAAGVKRLRFTYPEALPPGLLPRFIVRTHEMSTGQPRWRSGVVLAWGEARALVRLDRTQRQATVEVLGASQEEAQGLFDIIRAHLVVLHGKVRAVEELELAGHPDSWVSMEKLRLLERKGRHETDEETKERELVTVQVSPTLDTTESKEARVAEGPAAPARLRLFVSYASEDTRRLKALSQHLTILGRRGYIQAWDDKQLVPGERWDDQIMRELEAADIVLLIYSTGTRASTYVQEKEIPVALQREGEGKCTLLVVPLDRDDWDPKVEVDRRLGELMTATWKAKPVLKFTPQTEGWLEVEHSIRKAVLARRGRSGE